MTVIPFGLIGAVLGHWICGITMNAISLLGFFALTGVVVNDSLILVHYINRRVSEGAAPLQAALDAGTRRFRPILLTSLTTFFGLVPIVLERSMPRADGDSDGGLAGVRHPVRHHHHADPDSLPLHEHRPICARASLGGSRRCRPRRQRPLEGSALR